MNINWVLSNSTDLDPTVNVTQMKDCGSFWGGWRTWRSCATDNVICHEVAKANELIKRAFHTECNFYIPRSNYDILNKPVGVKIYEGEFIHDVDNQEEIIAMHLSASTSDIVLLLGFNFSATDKNTDRLAEHRAHNYRNLTRQVIVDNPTVQWVAINHPGEFRTDLQDLENLSQDSLDNVLNMLAG